MMKYRATPWLVVSHYVRKSLKKRYSQAESKEIMNNARKAYKNLLGRAEDIGYRSPMSSNLYMVLAFFSFHAGNRSLIKKDEMKKIIDEFYENRLIRRYLGMINLNKPWHFNAFRRGIHRHAEWIEKRRDVYPGNWDFDFNTHHVDGLSYRFTICPIARASVIFGSFQMA
ncbi:hypothetical protein [Arcanobacterium phocae]|uniref:hypothetical protein n=1 Tax=Arcanobacterium phocae TaxID=131112 RepID=UPI001C0F14F8|nr:hypothetical protein [Arcanobacterium phocae]